MSFIPLYQRVKERIRVEILAAQTDGDATRLPTERELETRYGVSRPTVSKALTALAAEGLLVKAQGRGSFVLAPSRPPESSIPRRIGFVVPLTVESLVQRAFRGIDRVAHRRDYRVLLSSAGNQVARERAAAQELIASGARGLVIYPVPRIGPEAAADYLRTEELGVPVVLIDTCVPEQGHTQLLFDNRRAGYAMMAWLLGKGHRRIGVLSYLPEIHHAPLAARLKGYREALCDHGQDRDPALLRRFQSSPLQATDLADILEEWMALSDPPTALIATEDVAALEVIQLLSQQGVRVPDDVCVVGFDNREVARRFGPGFTTTHPDFERMGEMACDLLLDGIEAGALPPQTFVLDVPLLVRRSPETPATAAVRALAVR